MKQNKTPKMVVVGASKGQTTTLEELSKDLSVQEDYSKICEMVTRGQLGAEESCLIQVLTQYLERKPTDDDFRNCTKIERQGIINSYVLAYKDVKLGLVSRSFMCNADIKNPETGVPDFVFNCVFNPDVIEVPETEDRLFYNKD